MDVEVIRMCAELRDLSEREATPEIHARMKYLARIVAAYCGE